MTNFAQFGSTKLDPRVTGATPEGAEDPSMLGEGSKGISRGLRTIGADTVQAGGLAAEAMGFNGAAKELRTQAHGLREAAAAPEFAAESPEFKDVHGFGQGVRWVMGKAGEMVPMMGAAVAGGVAAGPFVGGTLALAPSQIGAIDERQQADPNIAAQPVADRSLRAAGYGLAGAAVGNLPFGGLAGKFGAKALPGLELAGARSMVGAIGRNVGEGVVTGGIGMGGTEAATQMGVDPNAPLDTSRIGESALAGAVTMGAMHLPAAVPSYFKGAGQGIGESVGGVFNGAKQSINERLAARKVGTEADAGTAASKLDEAYSAAGKKVGSFYDDVTDFMSKGKDGNKGMAEKVAADMPLNVDNATLAKSTPEQILRYLDQSKEAASQWAAETGEALLKKSGMSEENIGKIQKAMTDLGDHANRATIATIKMATDASSDVSSRISGAFDRIKAGYDKAKTSDEAKTGVKKSEDYSGVEQAILDGLTENGFLKRRADITGSPTAANQLAATLRMYFDQMSRGPIDPRTIDHLTSLLGDDTSSVLNSVKNALGNSGMKPSEFTSHLRNLNSINKNVEEAGGLHSQLGNLMTEQSQDSMKGPELKQMLAYMSAHARGEHMSSPDAVKLDAAGQREHGILVDGLMRKMYQEHFGKNADKAAELIQKQTRLEAGDEHTGSTEYNDDGEEVPQAQDKVPRGQSPMFDSEGNRVQEETRDTMKFGLTAKDKAGKQKSRRNGRPYPDPESTHEAAVYTKRHLAELQAKYPDKHVSWEPSEEHVHLNDKGHAVGADRYGHIEVRDQVNPENVNDHTVEDMRLDTKKNGKSPSRVEFDIGDFTEKGEAKPLILDSYRIGQMLGRRGKQNDIPDLSWAHTLTKQFIEGVSALTNKYAETAGEKVTRLTGELGELLQKKAWRGDIEAKQAELSRFAAEDPERMYGMPTIPDDAVIGQVGNEKFTWGMAKKLKKSSLEDSIGDDNSRQLTDMKREMFQATATQKQLADANAAIVAKGGKPMAQLNYSTKRLSELARDIRSIENAVSYGKDRELTSDEHYDKRVAARKKLDPNVQLSDGKTIRPKTKQEDFGVETAPDGKRYLKTPYEEHRTDFGRPASGENFGPHGELLDANGKGTGRFFGGSMTAEGKRMMMSGDYDGGIEVGRASSRMEEADRISGGARFGGREFDGGTGQTQIGKDAQIHNVFAGGKDEPFSGGRYADPRTQQPGNVVRSNMDGTPHFVSDRWNELQYFASTAHQLKAQSGAVAKVLGDKLLALLKPEVQVRMGEASRDELRTASQPGLKNSSRAKILDALTEKYLGKPAEEVLVTAKQREDSRVKSKRTIDSEVDYDSVEAANDSLHRRVGEMSDHMAAYELRRRERLLDDASKGSDWYAILEEEVGLLRERLANGRAADDSLQYNPNFGTQQKPRDTIGEGKGYYELGRNKENGLRKSNFEDFKGGMPDTGQAEMAFGDPTESLVDRLVGELDKQNPNTSGAMEAAGTRARGGGLPGPKALAAKKAALLEAASSSNPELHKQLTEATDAASLQRTVDALIKGAPDSEALIVANSRMGELVKDPSVAYALQTKKFSMDASRADGSKPGASADVRKAVEEHIANVLGPKVSVAWKELSDMKYAGDYDHQQKAIRLSVHALNPMGTGFHESLHSFIASMKDAGAHDVAASLEKAASSEHVIKQLQEIYKGNPEVLKQLSNPEERAAYMYQHWALDPGNFKVSMQANTVLGKIAAFVRNLLGTWSNDERAVHIMDYFHKGEFGKNVDKPNYVREQLMNTHRSAILDQTASFTKPLADVADAVVSAGGSRLRDSGIPALSELADIIKRQHTDGRGGDRGFTQASRLEITKQITKLGERFGAAAGKPDVLRTAMEYMQSGEWGKNTTPEQRLEARNVVKTTRAHLKEMHDYMVRNGVDIGNLGPDYFPREWDSHYISQNQQAFRDMLEPYKRSGQMKGSVDTLVKNLMSQGGSELGIESREVREPGMQFKKQRMLDFIDPRDAAQFMKKDLISTLSSYTTQAVRKTEWTKRLGNGKLDALLEQARGEGATQQHLDLAEDYLKANDGTLGDNLNPTARRLMGNMIVYQNIRLLPMASFSMLIDPLGTVVRGAKMGEAWGTFKRGIAGIAQTFSKEGSVPQDRQTRFAELVGTVDSAMMSHAMSDVYTQGMVGGTAKDINNTFFKYNMVEGLNRNFRIGATESAMKFIQRHGIGDPESGHSDRWIRELGLKKGDVKTTADGHLALTEADGLTTEQVNRVHAAVNQWVDGAILRPDAADKPIWMNDPHFALIAHLKQFVYSFQHTILERVGHEMKHGNYQPAMALASYLPVMMAADFAKNFIVNGGGQPDWQKGWDMSDYIENGIERSGFYGVGQFGVDIAKNVHRGGSGVFALAGPTIEQLRDGVETLGGQKQFGTMAIDALPANALFKPALRASGVSSAEVKADPIAAD